MRMIAIAITTLLLAWTSAAPARLRGQSATSGSGTQPYPELRRWLDAVERHRSGEFDSPAVEVASWSEAELTRAAHDFSALSRFLVRAHARLRQTGRITSFSDKGRSILPGEAEKLLGLTSEEARSGDTTRLITRAVLLHTDVAIMLDDDRDRTTPVTAASANSAGLIVLDGRQQGLVDRPPHWRFSRTLLELPPHAAWRGEVPRRWYVATAAFMQGLSRLSDLVPHLERAQRLFPDDPDVLFAVGMLHEAMASPEVQDAAHETALPDGMKLGVLSARAHLGEARAAFRRALDQRPEFADARVRLGRVLDLLGRHDEAARELERVGLADGEMRLRYFAALFLGSAQEALGRHEAAAASFARAADLYPRAQSPHLALSRLARAAGNHAGAIAALEKVLALPADESARDDPWWQYLRPFGRNPTALIAKWRESVIDGVGR
jgi:hypothetical protein